MKKWMIYLGGIITGIVIAFAIFFFNEYSQKTETIEDDEVEAVLDEIEEVPESDDASIVEDNYIPDNSRVIDEKSFQVFDVWYSHAALVHGKSEYGSYTGTVYLLIEDNFSLNKITPFYDDQIINVPKDKEVRMYGTYKYPTNRGQYKTVPKIKIVYKQK